MLKRLQHLFLDLNSYFASVEQQEHPVLRGRPVAVVPTLADSSCAIAASYEAKAFGIKTGTRIYEAKKLCPGLITVPARHDVYVDYHHRIMEEIERHLPIAAVHSIDEACCKLIGKEQEPNTAVRIARNIKAGIVKTIGPAIKCSIGLSVNTYLAKLATDLEKPDGLVVLYPHELPERIASMRLSDLPWIGRNIERRLHASGVPDVATLWSLSPGRMRRIWGSVNGQRFWYMLHGLETPPIKTTKRMVGHSHVLAPDLRRPDQAYLVARRLAARAAARMRRMDYWASEVALGVGFVLGEGWEGRIAVPSTQDTLTLVQGVDALWRKMQVRYGPQRIVQVSIVLGGLEASESKQPDLFQCQSTHADRVMLRRLSLSKALDKLTRRYGRDTVTLGVQPKINVNYVGAKIAFTRIPAREEFFD